MWKRLRTTQQSYFTFKCIKTENTQEAQTTRATENTANTTATEKTVRRKECLSGEAWGVNFYRESF
jgi:hypothetical protein